MNIQPTSMSSCGMGFYGAKKANPRINKLIKRQLLSKRNEIGFLKQAVSKVTDLSVKITKFILDMFQGTTKRVAPNSVNRENFSKNTMQLIA